MTNPTRWLPVGLVVLALTGCSEPISDPWVSGQQAEALEAERSRGAEQKQALRGRLERYGGAYQ